MRRSLVVGNWKMNGSQSANQALLAQCLAENLGTAEVAVCPPALYVQAVAEQLKESSIGWGVQNLSEADSGAYTGEISAAMVADLGCHYAIVGHSERRTLYAETDSLVAAKALQASAAGVAPIVCVGETLQQREAGQTLEVVGRQLKALLDHERFGELGDWVVAYEPVWAIGTGLTATPAQAQQVHGYIRGVLAEVSGSLADRVRILYGGSVKAANAAELFAEADIDGGLVGGASLVGSEFIAICRAAG
ncbi:triose-phosphate isomerase [Aestuariirhabdus litorea]|uniref:Triosephosphate isomerase n=1 Tax=Aestuariirhabdus litorea TaxID=2528527 RepID=A0A3P3VN58_9GAMM|nr:triose-phosphate isomerase [Aestuariirhabdus litorea]RRJ83348.1 triose-phosphate isomerase [Aestuariirhabdus litorea]RWW93507.1 triose-phosphate isomerase [Endozoicomonadaceae bacterium GTF-13]